VKLVNNVFDFHGFEILVAVTMTSTILLKSDYVQPEKRAASIFRLEEKSVSRNQ
jgi:hypothetical protein